MSSGAGWARDRAAAVGQTTYYKLVAMFLPLRTGGTAASVTDLKVTVPTGPVGPTGLQASSPDTGKVILSWVNDLEAIGYSVWRWNGANRETTADVDASTTTFTDTELARRVTFRYSVFGKYPDPNTSMVADVYVTVR